MSWPPDKFADGFRLALEYLDGLLGFGVGVMLMVVLGFLAFNLLMSAFFWLIGVGRR